MPYLYVGANNKIAVIDAGTGRTIKEIVLNEAWLKTGNRFINMIKKDGFLYAHTYGRLYCVDIGRGQVVWSNELKGMGFDIASLISDDDNNVSGNLAAEQMYSLRDRKRSSD